MPLTDLRTLTRTQAFRFTSRFGLNRLQGTYFYKMVQKSAPGTYLADIIHVSQPIATSLLGRLLREACGTPPQLIPQEPVRHDNTQSLRAWLDLEMKHGHGRPRTAKQLPEATLPPTVPQYRATMNQPVQLSAESPVSRVPLPMPQNASTSIQEPTPPPLVARPGPGFATIPMQLPLSTPILEFALIQKTPNLAETKYGRTFYSQWQFAHISSKIKFYPLMGSGAPSLAPIYLPILYTFAIAERPRGSKPHNKTIWTVHPSPMLSNDVDMLTDTTTPSYYHAPWSQWSAVPEYVPISSHHSNMFITPHQDQVTVWELPVQEASLCVDQYGGFAASTPASPHPGAPAPDIAKAHPFAALPSPMDFTEIGFLSSLESNHHPDAAAPITAMSDRAQETIQISQETQNQIGSPQQTIVANLLDEFERSLILFADESSSSEPANQSSHDHHIESTPAPMIEDESRISFEPVVSHPVQTKTCEAPLTDLVSHLEDHGFTSTSVSDSGRTAPDNYPLYKKEAAEPEVKDETPACFVNPPEPLTPHFQPELMKTFEHMDLPPRDPSPRPSLPKEATEPTLEEVETRPPTRLLDLADITSVLDPASPQTNSSVEIRVPANRPSVWRNAHPLPPPRPPTPPLSRRSAKPVPRNPVDQCTALALAVVKFATPAAVRSSTRSTRRRKEEEREGEERKSRPRLVDLSDRDKKRTRFVVPDLDLDGELKGPGSTSSLTRPRRHGARVSTATKEVSSDGFGPSNDCGASSRRTNSGGPLRSILRNKHASPYQKAAGGRGGRRASMP